MSGLMRGTKRVTGPASLPWTLAEVKTHLRVEHDDEDLLIQGLLETAVDRVEDITGRRLITQTWDAFYDAFPTGREIGLPAPVQSVTSVTYTVQDAAAAATFASTNYVVDTVGVPGSIHLRDGASWPGETLEPVNGVVVRFVAGYGAAGSSVPHQLRQLLLMYVAHWYEKPETDPAQSPILQAIDNLVLPFRWE